MRPNSRNTAFQSRLGLPLVAQNPASGRSHPIQALRAASISMKRHMRCMRSIAQVAVIIAAACPVSRKRPCFIIQVLEGNIA